VLPGRYADPARRPARSSPRSATPQHGGLVGAIEAHVRSRSSGPRPRVAPPATGSTPRLGVGAQILVRQFSLHPGPHTRVNGRLAPCARFVRDRPSCAWHLAVPPGSATGSATPSPTGGPGSAPLREPSRELGPWWSGCRALRRLRPTHRSSCRPGARASGEGDRAGSLRWRASSGPSRSWNPPTASPPHRS
jgi:hypothetical protein